VKAAACCNVDSVVTLLALVDDAVVIADLDGNIAGCSHGAEELLGYPTAELLGRDCADIYAEDEREAHRERCRDVVLGTGPASFDVTLRTRSGTLHAARAEVALMFDVHGAPASLFINIRSGGETGVRPNVGFSELREFRALMDSSPVGIWHLDTNRRFAYANKPSLAMAGYDHSDVTGRHVRDVLGEALHQQLLPALDLALAGTDSVVEQSVLGADGSTRHYFMHLLPQRAADGHIEGCFVAVLDVTQAKLSQENQLRREQLLRATLIRETNHRIKNSLQGLLGMLRLQAARRVPAQDVIDQSVAQLMAVTVAFGLASRHGEAQILLCDMVTDIASNVEQLSQRRIQVQLSPAAVREPVALSERYGTNMSLVINELMFNAIKHSTNAEGPRGVRVMVDRGTDSAVLRVINEGGQLPPGFSLASNTGLGTGLSLIKVLVPPESSRLSIEEGPEGVCAELMLRPPVLSVPGG
jgi:PAS domain S-box-containing protein